MYLVVSIIRVQSSIRLAIAVDVESGQISTHQSLLLSHAETESDRKKRLPLPTSINAQEVCVWYLEILIIYNNKSAFCLILYRGMQAKQYMILTIFSILGILVNLKVAYFLVCQAGQSLSSKLSSRQNDVLMRASFGQNFSSKVEKGTLGAGSCASVLEA